MKNSKKFIATAAAIVLAACAAAPMAMTASAASIEITNIGTSVGHTFEVYQVFTGKYNSDGTLSELKWGADVTAYDSTAVTAGTLVSTAVLEALGDDARAIAKKLTYDDTPTDTKTSSGDTLTFEGLADGYYVIKDTTDLTGEDDANSAYIVKVAGSTATSVAIKKSTPKLDKLVLDEIDDAEAGATNGWGESADHAINETFQFKLVATIPADDDLAYYDKYELIFSDTMSAGVTYAGNVAVYVDGNQITNGFAATGATEGQAGQSMTVTVDDVKAHLGDSVKLGSKEIKVEVVYDAYLNEAAIVTNANVASTTDINKNTVGLQYSNNPDSTGGGTHGTTPTDTVWVFTYQMLNTKYEVSAEAGNELKDAEFQLVDSDGNAVYFTLDGSKYYAATSTTDGASTTIKSLGDGTFNLYGLDAGTYTLTETKAPAGYNAVADMTITIAATHAEDADGAAVTLSNHGVKNGDVDMTNGQKIVDTKNNSLPSTGGIGTTLFLLGGGALVGVSGVYLVSKKRAKSEEEK